MKKTTYFPREAKVADSRVFRLVNESIEAKSLMLLQEADETDEDDKVDEDRRAEQLEAFNDMQRLLKNAGFIKTATALERGARVLTRNVAKSGKEASSYFMTAIFMMRSMQTLLRRVAVTAAALNAQQESRNLNDLDALHEALFSKSLLSILLKEADAEDDTTAFNDAPTKLGDESNDSPTKTVASNSVDGEPPSTSGRNTIPSAKDNDTVPNPGETVALGNNNGEGQADPNTDTRQNNSQPKSPPLLASKNSDGEYDEELAKADVQNLISAAFKPDAEFTKWLGKTKISDGIDRRGKALNEGISDWLKRIFGGSAPTASTVIKAMRPLVGGKNLAELLQDDLLSPLGAEDASKRIAAIKTAQNKIALAIPRITGGNSPPPPPVPAAPAGAGGSSTSGGSTPSPSSDPTDVRTPSSETQRPTQSSEAPRGDRQQGPGEPAPQRGATRSGAKSLRSLLDVSDASKVKQAIDDSQIDINVSTGQTGLDDEGKKKLSAALEDFENDAKRELKAKLSSTFSESRKAKNEDLIIERWQRLAGIIK